MTTVDAILEPPRRPGPPRTAPYSSHSNVSVPIQPFVPVANVYSRCSKYSLGHGEGVADGVTVAEPDGDDVRDEVAVCDGVLEGDPDTDGD